MAEGRMFRVIVLGGASLVGIAILSAGCRGDEETARPACTTTVYMASPCGFKSVTTTCSGQPCTTTATPTGCLVGPVTSSCAISVLLGDGTKHDVAVTVGSDPRCPGVVVQSTSQTYFATCVAAVPEAGAEGAADASTDADASRDASKHARDAMPESGRD
jgi:hypothetical protein